MVEWFDSCPGPLSDSRADRFPNAGADAPVHYVELRTQRGRGQELPSPVTFGPGMVRAAVGGWQLWRYRRYRDERCDRTDRMILFASVVGQRTRASSTEHDVGVEFDAADS